MTPEDVIFKLGQLEPDEIARLMKDSGVQANRACSHSCAVTQFVYGETKAQRISTGLIDFSYHISGKGYEVVQLPESVQTFVRRFDDGIYPELDALHPTNQVA